jgi:hypothetical protein
MRTPAAGRSASKPSLGFDRRDDSFEVEACTPAGFGDRLRRGGFVRYETGLVAGNEDDPQEAQQVSVVRDLFGCCTGPGSRSAARPGPVAGR